MSRPAATQVPAPASTTRPSPIIMIRFALEDITSLRSSLKGSAGASAAERPAVDTRIPFQVMGVRRKGCGRPRFEYRLQIALAVDGLGRVLDGADKTQDVSGVALDPRDLSEEDVEPAGRAGEAGAEPGGVVVTPDRLGRAVDRRNAAFDRVDRAVDRAGVAVD